MQLSTAVLCDFAQIRDGLLFVSSGAISRLYRRGLPSPLGLMVGLVIEIPVEDAGDEHELVAQVINRQGEELAVVRNAFRVGDHNLFPHEVQQAPAVISVTGVEAVSWGTHQVRLYLDDVLDRTLTFYVVPSTAGPVPLARQVEEAPDGTEAAGDDAEPVEGPDVGTATATATAAGDTEAGAADADDEPDREPVPAFAQNEREPALHAAAAAEPVRPLPAASAWLLRARRAWSRRA
jgi:hypothetical protein